MAQQSLTLLVLGRIARPGKALAARGKPDSLSNSAALRATEVRIRRSRAVPAGSTAMIGARAVPNHVCGLVDLATTPTTPRVDVIRAGFSPIRLAHFAISGRGFERSRPFAR